MAVPREVLTAYVQRNKPDPGVLPNNPQSIKKFQRFHGLTPDGIVGPKTKATMRRLNTRLGYTPQHPYVPSPAPQGPPLIGHPRTSPGPTGRRIEPA